MTKQRPYRGLTKEGKWVYGDKIEFDCLCYILPKGRAIILSSKVAVSGKDCGASVCGFIQVIPETVGQFTGLKDKKLTKEYPEGQEIYDGDCCRGKQSGTIYKVIFRDGEYSLVYDSNSPPVKDYYHCSLHYALCNLDIEWYGNIHQPELMEQDNED